MKTWADELLIDPPSLTVDRFAGQGPTPRCCARRLVAADALVHYSVDEMLDDALAKVLERFPHLAATKDGPYLCDACRETLRREEIIARTDMPTARPLQLPDAI